VRNIYSAVICYKGIVWGIILLSIAAGPGRCRSVIGRKIFLTLALPSASCHITIR
jgi:hypothetical protein